MTDGFVMAQARDLEGSATRCACGSDEGHPETATNPSALPELRKEEGGTIRSVMFRRQWTAVGRQPETVGGQAAVAG